MKIKLAEALLKRKDLQAKVDRLKAIQVDKLFEVKIKRQAVNDNYDDIVANVPKISMQQANHCFDWHAKQLRLIDAAIQQANWNTELGIDDDTMKDYIDPYIKVNN